MKKILLFMFLFLLVSCGEKQEKTQENKKETTQEIKKEVSNGKTKAKMNGDIQEIETTFGKNNYMPIEVFSDVPLKWTINVSEDDLNNCNKEFNIPKYKINVKLKVGSNIVEFTPTGSGSYPYSCWMGMIKSTISFIE